LTESRSWECRCCRHRRWRRRALLVADEVRGTKPGTVLHVQRAGLPLRQCLLPKCLDLRDERSRAHRPNSRSNETISRIFSAWSPQYRGIAKLNPDIQLFSDYRHATDARRRPIPGTLPILYVFLARSGKTVQDVSLVRIDQDGTTQVDDGAVGVGADAKSPRGVKIEFVGENGKRQTLYYFTANVENDGFKPSGFMRFCERLGSGDAFVKSASYLMHPLC
jgi:hypothetical protein